jgi:protein-S-isoprenylcysteine O-methyltransferase Ste14
VSGIITNSLVLGDFISFIISSNLLSKVTGCLSLFSCVIPISIGTYLTMLSLFFRNLFFTILQPGLVAGLIPYWILGRELSNIRITSLQLRQYAGVVLFIIGLAIMLSCIVNFAVKGRGTLSPADPTKHLVVGGLYKYSRNPMYVGVMMMLIGEAIFFESTDLWVYLIIVFIGFHLFILLHEEPRLKKDFEAEYKEYCKKVRRWI